MSSKEELAERFVTVEEQLCELQANLEAFLSKYDATYSSSLPPIEAAKIHVSLAYTMETALFCTFMQNLCSSILVYMRMKGGVPHNHPIHKDMDRVKKYLDKVRQVEGESKKKSMALAWHTNELRPSQSQR